ncbi:MAG: hypothetical protein QXX78_06920 [Nitrososphaerota archaeon]
MFKKILSKLFKRNKERSEKKSVEELEKLSAEEVANLEIARIKELLEVFDNVKICIEHLDFNYGIGKNERNAKALKLIVKYFKENGYEVHDEGFLCYVIKNE